MSETQEALIPEVAKEERRRRLKRWRSQIRKDCPACQRLGAVCGVHYEPPVKRAGKYKW